MKNKEKREKKILSFKTKYIIAVISFVVFMFLYYYFTLPFINFTSKTFYFYLFLLLGFIICSILVFSSDKLIEKNKSFIFKVISYNAMSGKFYKREVDSKVYYKKTRLVVIASIFTLLVYSILMIFFAIIGTKLFQANRYYKQLEINLGTEEELMTTFDFEDGEVLLPIIDKDLAFKLAQASLGDYGAQYTIDYDNFTLITVNRNGDDQLVRIAPLEYSNFFVSLSRMNKGTIGYIEVNVVTKETRLVEVEGGMKYMPTGLIGKDLDRHIHFNFPTTLYDGFNFEIDDTGKPYWIIPTHKREIGLISGPTPYGVIVIDPVTGEGNEYKLGEEPAWIDRTISEIIINEQATNAFRYKNGFANVHFGEKKEVFQLSDGYNYFLKNGNTYYVSTITSPNENDQTSIGFVAINLKTKEATKYMVKGITEMRAREIAMNDVRVKAQLLDATWPILINYKGVETYFMVLKNSVQEQKFVLVNVETGEHIAIGDTLLSAEMEYDKLLADSGNSFSDLETVNGRITNIRDLDSKIEFMIEGINDVYFMVEPSVSIDARFMKIGDLISVKCKKYDSYYYVLEYQKQ